MEIFSQNYATAYGRTYSVTPEEYLQDSFEPANRLTTRELQQIRAVREEIESRPKVTRFEARYIRLLAVADREFCGIRPDCSEGIKQIRALLKEVERTTARDKLAITISFLIAAISRYANQ